MITMTMMSDMLIRGRVESRVLRTAVARAFQLSDDAVFVTAADAIQPPTAQTRVFVVHEDRDMPGDFPDWYSISIDPALEPRHAEAMDRLAHELSLPILTDAPDDRQMTLHLPDGTGVVVDLIQDHDGAFVMTPEIRRLIDRASPRVALAS